MYSSLAEAYQVPSFALRKKDVKHAPPTPSQTPIHRKFGREDFIAGPTSNKDTTGSPLVDSVSYSSGQAADYAYYGKQGFKYPVIAANGIMEPFAILDQNGSGNSGTQDQCPSQDTTYRIPVSDAAKKNYDAAMKVAIDSDAGGSTSQILPKMRVADMRNVTGYHEDEDLEQYLRVSDMKAAPMTSPISPYSQLPLKTTTGEASSPFTDALSHFNGQLRPSPIPQEDMSGENKFHFVDGSFLKAHMMDLLLFVLCGLLVIFLCDQLYKLATMTGMRDTIEFIRPFLDAQTVGDP